MEKNHCMIYTPQDCLDWDNHIRRESNPRDTSRMGDMFLPTFHSVDILSGNSLHQGVSHSFQMMESSQYTQYKYGRFVNLVLRNSICTLRVDNAHSNTHLKIAHNSTGYDFLGMTGNPRMNLVRGFRILAGIDLHCMMDHSIHNLPCCPHHSHPCTVF